MTTSKKGDDKVDDKLWVGVKIKCQHQWFETKPKNEVDLHLITCGECGEKRAITDSGELVYWDERQQLWVKEQP